MAKHKPIFHDTALATPAPTALNAHQIWESMQDGLLIAGRDGEIQYANAAVFRLLGVTQKVIGEQLADVITRYQVTHRMLILTH